ncbi:MAG: YggT family protein [Candidatus Paceibacterota bacterium]
MNSSYNSASTKPIYRGTQIVWYILGIIETLLAFRFILKMMGANPYAGFSSFIYSVTSPFAGPFASVFKRSAIEGSVLEWTTLLAMFVYWVIAIGIIHLFLMNRTVSTREAATKLDRGQTM